MKMLQNISLNRSASLPFFLGLAIGFAALSWLGSRVGSSPLIENFVRFHHLMSVESGFFATARNVQAIIDQQTELPSKVYVIVGGTSILNGVGQHVSLVWTRFLQEELSHDFRVINFAQRGGWGTDFGGIGAELLLRQSRAVIFIGDSFISGYAAPLDRSFYRHIIFDAWQREYLLPWAPRDKLLSQAVWNQSLQSTELGSALNAYFNFNELWNFVSFEFANTNWNPLLNHRSFSARKLIQDDELNPEEIKAYRYAYDLNAEMQKVRNNIPLSAEYLLKQSQLIEQSVPPQLRAVTLVTVDLESPYYRDRLSPAEQQAYLAQAEAQIERMQKLGFNRAVMPSKDFTEEDYIDRVHLSVSGGKKLAAALAPIVRTMALQLGYVK
jgi:hypothetical protein